MRTFLISLVFASFLAAPAFAANALLSESTPQEILAFHSDLLNKLEASKVDGLDGGDAAKLTHQSTIATKLLGGVDDWADLGQDNQLTVFNIHESVRGLLAEAAERGQEKVCKQERLTGSNMSKLVCRTRAEIEREKHIARDGLRRMQEKHPGKPNR